MLIEELQQLENPDILKIIHQNIDKSPHELSLKLKNNKGIPHRAISEQVSCYQKAKTKLPSFIEKSILFEKNALEQSSSEFTARYKSSLISGDKLLDLTGGLGIDDVFFATSFNVVTYCELNPVLAYLMRYNLKKQNILNIEINNFDSIELLKNSDDNSYDWIYVDPSRRDENRRSVDLEYCTPNVYENMELFFQKSQNVMIKAAPAYDLTEASRKFPYLSEIHVVSVDGECKEVVLILRNTLLTKNIKIFAVSLNSKNGNRFISSDYFTEKRIKNISEIKTYFYEPECSIIKSNLTALIAKQLQISFINNSSPFLTSSELIKDFPGRSFKITQWIKFNELEIKKYLKQNGIIKANITRRDFRLSVDEIRKRLKLKDGGNIYLFFTSDINKKGIMIVCEKVI
ncbi:MAG: class I SAM-dependent methyltransferase [Bacteroidetes bacterium]|nr:class I SAM-dependent methyltransferase [Bacteroidota bacterium]MBU1114474.1 class I SAM-dependent methyltransferase [Bacteroidota bacterium]MBU1796935.1 class I SAM-dependent methyltransferase [Bacteroidota bacterium]